MDGWLEQAQQIPRNLLTAVIVKSVGAIGWSWLFFGNEALPTRRRWLVLIRVVPTLSTSPAPTQGLVEDVDRRLLKTFQVSWDGPWLNW